MDFFSFPYFLCCAFFRVRPFWCLPGGPGLMRIFSCFFTLFFRGDPPPSLRFVFGQVMLPWRCVSWTFPLVPFLRIRPSLGVRVRLALFPPVSLRFSEPFFPSLLVGESRASHPYPEGVSSIKTSGFRHFFSFFRFHFYPGTSFFARTPRPTVANAHVPFGSVVVSLFLMNPVLQRRLFSFPFFFLIVLLSSLFTPRRGWSFFFRGLNVPDFQCFCSFPRTLRDFFFSFFFFFFFFFFFLVSPFPFLFVALWCFLRRHTCDRPPSVVVSFFRIFRFWSVHLFWGVGPAVTAFPGRFLLFPFSPFYVKTSREFRR